MSSATKKEKPKALAIEADNIPAELRALNRWVLWRYAWDQKRAAWAKPPHRAGGNRGRADTTDPKTWVSFAAAHGSLLSRRGDFEGLGFVFAQGDGLVGIDIDKCFNEAGELTPEAAAIVESLSSYTEISPSGRGLHIVVRAELEGGRRERGIEVYGSERYFTMTGRRFKDTPATIKARPIELGALLSDLDKKARRAAARAPSAPSTKRALPTPLDDDDVLKRLRSGRSGAKFEQLWNGDTSGHDGNASSADQALTNYLARGTRGDRAQMDRLFRLSGLMRPKWDEVHYATGETYGQHTIETALDRPLLASSKGNGSHGDHKPEPKHEGTPAAVVGSSAGLRAELPEIIANASQATVHQILEDAEGALLKAKCAIYQRAGKLVRIQVEEAQSGIAGTSPTIQEVPNEPLWADLDACAQFVLMARTPEGDIKKRTIRPPSWVARGLLTKAKWKFAKLRAITESPLLLPDGRVLDEPGFHEQSGIFFSSGTAFPKIPEAPTRDDALRALAELSEPFQDFPFRSPAHRSAALALVVTPFVVHAIKSENLPFFLITARAPGSGKTLLAEVACLIATGREPDKQDPMKDSEDERKAIFSALLAGRNFVLFDNIERSFGSASLSLLITSRNISGRVLRTNDYVTVENNAVWVGTGNNVHIKGELSRRIIYIDIDPAQENPESREGFKIERLKPWVLEHRARLVAATLTMLRAYVVAGRPNPPRPTFGSFEAWSDLVRGLFLWLGQEDPLKASKDLREHDDPERNAIEALMNEWFLTCGSEPLKASQLFDLARSSKGLREALDEIDLGSEEGAAKTIRLGMVLRRWKGRVIAGKKIEMAPKRGTMLWSIGEISYPLTRSDGVTGG